MILKSFAGFVYIRALARTPLDPTVGRNSCGNLNLDGFAISQGEGGGGRGGADSIKMTFAIVNMS